MQFQGSGRTFDQGRVAVVAASAVSEVPSAQAVTRATVRGAPSGRSADISADTIAMRLPGRSTRARTRTSLTGIAPRMSRLTRPMRIPSATVSSIAFVSRANGGEPCWISGVQLLRVWSVEAKTWASPSLPSRR